MEESLNCRLHEAAASGNLEILEQEVSQQREALGYPAHDILVCKSSLLNAQPLHTAAENGHSHIVQVRMQ
jgi:hypothetical protein